MRLVHSAIKDEPEPRAAMTISLLTGESLDMTLTHLRDLEKQGQVRHKADEAGVVRWELVPEESGAAMELGAEVWMAGHYGPTTEQAKRLGL